MKVQMTLENKAYYEDLFARMTSYCANLSDDLKNNHGLASMPSEIKTLTTYYEWLDKMRGLDNYDLFRIPVEEQEGFFEIDLNTRTISVPGALKEGNVTIRPSSFKENGIGVQGDHAAEILYFKCARFFDDMDLSLCKENSDNPKGTQGACWIQWKRPGESNVNLSLAYNFDINAGSEANIEDDTLIFGWILSDIATEIAGDLEFSVRFVQWNPIAPSNVGLDNPQELTYSLSTLSTKCKIHSSLSAQYDLGDISVEKNLNQLVNKRKIYSGIYQTAFGAYPVILSNGDLPLSANLQDYDDETGVYRYYVTAYSPDNGTLSATWFQDIYGDAEEHVQVDLDRATVVEPESTGGNYTFGFTANAAGSYYAVISNTNPENGSIRTTMSNGSIIEHASDFTLEESIPTRAYITDASYAVTPVGANGIASATPVNDYNGVTYQWYIQPTTGETGKYKAREAIAGATESTFVPATYLEEHPAALLDGLLDCEVTNMRNKNTLTVKSQFISELRAEPTEPNLDFYQDEITGDLIINTNNETDFRDLSYKWTNLTSHYNSTASVYAPWTAAGSTLKSGDKITVVFQALRTIWPGTELEKQKVTTISKEIIVP